MLLLSPTLPPPIHPSLPPSPADPRSTPSLLPFPFLTSLSPALFPHVSPPFPLSSLFHKPNRRLIFITSLYPLRIPVSLTKVSLEARVNTNANSNPPQLSQTFTAHFNNRYQKNWIAYVFDESVPESCFPFKKEEQKEYLSPSASRLMPGSLLDERAFSHQPTLV